MSKFIRKNNFIMILVLIGVSSNICCAKDARQIMVDSDERSKPHDQYTEYKIEIFDHDKVVSSRTLIKIDKKESGKNCTLLRFTDPISVKGVGALIENSEDSESNIWAYTPATKTLRRISSSQKQNWFMGTDFTYEDFEDYKLNAYLFEIVEKNEYQTDKPTIVIDALPNEINEVKASGYSKKRYVLDTESLYPVTIEFYDKNKQLTKKLVSENLKVTNGYTRPSQETMFNYTRNSKTVITTMKSKINKGVSDIYFSPRYLKNED